MMAWQKLKRLDGDPRYVTNPRLRALQEREGIEPSDETWANSLYQVVVRFMTPNAPPPQWETAGKEWRFECPFCDHWIRSEDKGSVEESADEHMAAEHRTRTGMMHLSIHRHDREPIREWRHFQQIKNEVGGLDRQAVELFPHEAKLVDTSNEYHLWVLPAGVELPFGFTGPGIVTTDAQTEAYNEARNQGAHQGKQQPWEPGLTTGRNELTMPLEGDDEAAFRDLLKGNS